MMKGSKKRVLLMLAFGLFVAAASVAGAHTYFAGGGNDTVHGHDHADYLHGGAGCDDVLGHGASDDLIGGDNGCDKVRGEGGFYDESFVWEDAYGNDQAYGGDGGGDACYAGNQDYVDVVTCEVIVGP
jgi:Ca2+-binding RTX toxin-like protein